MAKIFTIFVKAIFTVNLINSGFPKVAKKLLYQVSLPESIMRLFRIKAVAETMI